MAGEYLAVVRLPLLILLGLTLAQCGKSSIDFSYSIPSGWSESRSAMNAVVFQGPHQQLLSFFSEPVTEPSPDVRRWNIRASLKRQHGSLITDELKVICSNIPARYVHAVLTGSRSQEVQDVSAIWNHRLYTAAYFYSRGRTGSSEASRSLFTICPIGAPGRSNRSND